MKKVLLVSFYASGDTGLRILASRINKHYNISYLFILGLDENAGYASGKHSNEALFRFISSFDYVLVSGTSYHKRQIYNICDSVREKNSSTRIIVGGALGMYEPDETLEHCDSASIWFADNILDLLKSFDTKTERALPNFITKKNAKRRYLSVKNLDEIPFPDFSAKSFYYLKSRLVASDFMPNYVKRNHASIP